MSNEPEKKVKSGSEIEYAFERVPADKRKTFATILVIFTGYTISLSNFVTGATVGSKMGFGGAVVAIILGNAILAFVAIMLGMIGAKSGKTTLVIFRNLFGKRGSAIMSILIALSAVNWIAVNANTFAQMIQTNFKFTAGIPMGVIAVIGIVKWLLPIIQFLSILLPPLPAMMIAEQWIVKNSKEGENINWIGLISWAVAGVCGQIAKNTGFFVPALVSMIVGFVVYIILSKALDKTLNKKANGKAE